MTKFCSQIIIMYEQMIKVAIAIQKSVKILTNLGIWDLCFLFARLYVLSVPYFVCPLCTVLYVFCALFALCLLRTLFLFPVPFVIFLRAVFCMFSVPCFVCSLCLV